MLSNFSIPCLTYYHFSYLVLPCKHAVSCTLLVVYTVRRLSNEEITRKRSELFGQEKARQMALINRIEKIEVHHKGAPENCTLLMNKGLSTPYNCAMRM